MKHICISHAPLRYVPRVTYDFISPHPIVGVESEVIPDDSLGAKYDGQVLSEYLQLFVLADRWRGIDELIHLFQYRRFLSPIATRGSVIAGEGIIFVSGEDIADVTPSMERLSSVRLPTFGSIMDWPMAEQYGRIHYMDDLNNFVRATTLCGTLTKKESAQFLGSRLFIPSPSIGIYPSSMIVEHLDLLRRTWDCFRDRFYVPREGYQRRVGGFLLERMHSYLILRHFDRNPGAKANVWYRIVLDNAVRNDR